MSKRVFKISYNPYLKKIEYQVKEEGESWQDLGPNSKLIRDSRFSGNISLQHCAMDIVEEIKCQYHPQKIIFEGTEEDYQDLKNVIDNFYEEEIFCKKGDYYIESAQNLLPKIEEKFSQLDRTFQECQSPEISNIIGKFKEVMGVEIPVFVMGTYSAGKSAFINAMIGAEILPSSEKTTTAKIYKISESKGNDRGEVKFFNNGKEIKIEFDKNKKCSLSKEMEQDLQTMISQSLKKNSRDTITSQLFYCISAINSYANENSHKIGDIIEVRIPFNGLLKNDKNTFVIYDSPGSNSEICKEHFKVLENALESQTNGLPIILTVPDNVESVDVGEIRKTLNKFHNLDKTNAMLVVNKADNSGEEGLKERTSDNRILVQWKLNRLYFLSAIMGLVSKLEDIEKNGWLNKIYKDSYPGAKAKLTEGNLKLYQYNIMPQNRKVEYCRNADELGVSNTIYVNSGLHCIETEILNFAQKQASYHKCKMAQKFLEQAIEYTDREIAEKEKKVKEMLEQTKQRKEQFREELVQCLNHKIETLKNEFIKEYPNHMLNVVTNTVKEVDGYLTLQIEEGIEETKVIKENGLDQTIKILTPIEHVKKIFSNKTKSVEKNSVDEFIKFFKPIYFSALEEAKSQIFKVSKKYWDSKCKFLKEECCEIVKGSQSMTKKDKQILEDYIMNFSIPVRTAESITIKRGDISKAMFETRWFRIWLKDEVDAKLVHKKSLDKAKDSIRGSNTEIIQLHKNEFASWKEELKNGLQFRLGEMNPKLQEFELEIQKLEREIKQRESQKKFLNDAKSDLNKLYQMEIRK